MKKIFTLLFIFLILITIASCGGGGGNKTPKYSISIETNGGSDVPSFSVEGEQSDYEITSPTKEGYTFAGWYTNPELTKKWYGLITSDLTLYAKWTINSYKISYVTNGAEDIDPVSYDYNALLNEQPTPTLKGYTFGGWYLDEELTE